MSYIRIGASIVRSTVDGLVAAVAEVGTVAAILLSSRQIGGHVEVRMLGRVAPVKVVDCVHWANRT